MVENLSEVLPKMVLATSATLSYIFFFVQLNEATVGVSLFNNYLIYYWIHLQTVTLNCSM